jgi:hypothetical protein
VCSSDLTIKAVAYDANGNSASAETQQNFVPFPADFTIIIVILVVVSIVVPTVALFVMARRKKKN